MLDALVSLHRWAGLVFSLLFVVWFASAIVMVFVPFPSLSNAERTAHGATFDPNSVQISPAQAQQIAGGGEAARLISMAGRPAYVVTLPFWPQVIISADDGQPLLPLSPVQAKAAAEAFGGGQAFSVKGPIGHDQWTLSQKLDGLRPFYRVRMGGPGSVDLYVSKRTGEVVQRTRRAERFWNWPGSIIHSLSIAALRSDFGSWNQTLRWLSFGGLLVALTGYFLGLFRLAQSVVRDRQASPFTSWLKWHHLLGLTGGLFVLAWIFSGWLSTDNGWLFRRGVASPAEIASFSGLPLSGAAEKITVDDLRRLGPSARITFGAVAGQAFASATGGPQNAPRLVLAGSQGPALPRLPDSLITQAVYAAWRGGRSGAVEPTSPGDFYAKAEDMPGATVSVRSQSGMGPRVYIDPVEGRLVTVMDSSRALYDWLYYGLHSFRAPGLVERPVLRAAIVLPPLLIGLAFSITSLVVGIRRLRLLAPKAKRKRVFGVKVLQRSLDQ